VRLMTCFMTHCWRLSLYGGLGVVVLAGVAGCGLLKDPAPVSLATPTSTEVPSPTSPSPEEPSSTRPAVVSTPSTRGGKAGAQGQLAVAADFIRRIPADVRAGGCRPEVTTTTPAVPYVDCDHPSTGRSVIFRIYPNAASMNANFDENLYANVPVDSSDCSTPRHTSTYRSGSHRGRVQCVIETAGGNGVIVSTDESNFVLINVSPGTSGKTRYRDGYRLWRASLEVAPA
jgi:hypothetical protein